MKTKNNKSKKIVKPESAPKPIRLTLNRAGELWLHVKTTDGRGAGLDLTELVERNVARGVICDVATKV